MKGKILGLLLGLAAGGPVTMAQSVKQLTADYLAGCERLHIPQIGFDYQENLRRIPPPADVQQQQTFFRTMQRRVAAVRRAPLSPTDQISYDHLTYELDHQLAYLPLALAFRPGAAVPATGLAALPNHHAWYAWYAHHYTSTALTPDELFAFGQQQVRRVQGEIRRLRGQLGYAADSAGFYRMLAADSFFLTDSSQILRQYRVIERRTRARLPLLFADTAVPALGIRTWPGATPAMPPGIYREGTYDFNFATGRHNRRAMAWIFAHEGLPGHHYQFSIQHRQPALSPLSEQTFYSGNAEGWGCYVEYLGRELDLYAQPAQELGKWEWDLVRSARVVLDVGIHDRGWTKAQALAYWHANVPGQADIAEREINRVTAWPGQCLSYKVGADFIEQQRTRLARQPGFDIRRFHAAYLALSGLPLEVVARHLDRLYQATAKKG